jgi:hypothetical protein
MINKLLHITHLQEYDSNLMKFLRLFTLHLPFKYFASIILSVWQGWNPQEFDPVFQILFSILRKLMITVVGSYKFVNFPTS